MIPEHRRVKAIFPVPLLHIIGRDLISTQSGACVYAIRFTYIAKLCIAHRYFVPTIKARVLLHVVAVSISN